MRALLTGILVLLLHTAWAQTGPGGVGNSTNNVLWLSADHAVYVDGGITPATNNNNVGQWNDRSGNGRHAAHAVTGERPNFQTGVLNGLPVIRFTAASNDRLLSTGVSTGDAASIWAVASYTSLPSTNPGIVQGSPAGAAFSASTSEKVIGLWVSGSGGNQVWGRGVQSNGTQRDIPQVTGTSPNTFYSILNLYDGNGGISQYVNNGLAGSTTYNSTLSSWSDFGIGRQAGESWNGDIAEVIAFNQGVNAAQRIIVNNYLAAKYNLTLSANEVYTMDNGFNGNYDFEVAGIGRVNASNIHSDAQGTGIVRILNPGSLGDNEFFMWGHNNGALQATNTSDIPSLVTARFDRVWGVSETGDVGSIDLQFDLSGLPDFSTVSSCDAALALRLLVDTDGDGSFADQTPISGANNIGGNIYRFSNISTLGNGMRFTLAVYNPANNGPGGIGNVAMWWRADAGVTANGGLISVWADQAGNGRNLTAAGGARPSITVSAAMNSQPVVRYSGSQYFSSSFSGPGVNNLTLMMAANGSSYQSLFRFQNTSATFVVYPWEAGGARTFISSSDGGTGSGIASGLVNNVNNVGGARYQRNTTNGMRTYRNGAVNAQRTSANSGLPGEPFFSGVYNPGSSEYPVCDVGEMIVYYTALNDAQMIILQNYLAAKFNVALTANDAYRADDAGNGNFDFDVAGIGMVNASNTHTDARGTGMVRIFNPTDLGSNEFLMWGHDNGSLATVNTTNVPTGVEARLNRIWRVSERNAAGSATVNVGNVDIQIDLSGQNVPVTYTDLRLLIDHDGDGDFAEPLTVQAGPPVELACGSYLFAGVSGANLTDGDRFTIGTTNATQTPLPVTLVSFTGTIMNGDARLAWITASEVNNHYFTVERSVDGSHFDDVGTVAGAGTTAVRQQYDLIDPFVPFGKIYYRLKQTDFDGEASYSNLIVLENESPGVKLIAVPNPAAPGQSIKLRITSAEQVGLGEASIQVMDLTGKGVPVNTEVDHSGQVTLFFKDSQAAGIYVIMIRSPHLGGLLSSRIQLVR
jgi:hypothetical protein